VGTLNGSKHEVKADEADLIIKTHETNSGEGAAYEITPPTLTTGTDSFHISYNKAELQL
jgi:hypothetical protein